MLVDNLCIFNLTRKISNEKTRNKNVVERVSSGKRINRAADDAAGCGITESFKAQVRGLSRAERNIQEGISMLQVADGALGDITDKLHKLKEMAVEAANDTLSDDDRKTAEVEFDQLKKSIQNIVNTTESNGKKLLNKNKSLTFQIKDTPFLTYDAKLYDNSLEAIGLKDTNLLSRTSCENAIEDIDKALQITVSNRINIGDEMNDLSHSLENVTNSNVNTTSSLSRIEDTDVAKCMMTFVKNNILRDYSKSLLVSARQTNESVKVIFEK